MDAANRSEQVAEKLSSELSHNKRIKVKNIASLLCIASVMGLSGCVVWPVSKEGVIGTYQSVLEDGTQWIFEQRAPVLPDGGTEILELKADGTCHQLIKLKDGRTFTAQGVWEWRQDDCYFATVIITGIYWTIDSFTQRINPRLEESLGNVVQSFPVGRTVTGRIMLGSDEGCHYEKK